MTVCVGICSEEGAVLAADSKITYGNKHQTYGPKITHIGNRKFCVGLAGAGYKDLMDEGFQEIRDGLDPLTKPTEDKIRKNIKKTMALLAGLYPDEIKEQEWLCVISSPPSTVGLTRFWKHIPVPNEELAIIGCGKDSVTDHLASWVTKKPRSNAEALRWAIFLIMQASQFVPGCGGPINALVFTPNGKVDERSVKETAQIEAELKELHSELSDVFQRVMIAKPNKSEADMALRAFGERVKRIISENNT